MIRHAQLIHLKSGRTLADYAPAAEETDLVAECESIFCKYASTLQKTPRAFYHISANVTGSLVELHSDTYAVLMIDGDAAAHKRLLDTLTDE